VGYGYRCDWQERFTLGVYSSATVRTVTAALAQIETAVGPGERPLFQHVLERRHCSAAPEEVRTKAWDTVKPLGKYFNRLDRIVLLDDDTYKSLPEERGNLVCMPCWDDTNADDTILATLVTALLQHIPLAGDVRLHTAAVSAALAAAAAAAVKSDAAEAALRAGTGEVQRAVDEQRVATVAVTEQPAEAPPGVVVVQATAMTADTAPSASAVPA
jgi:hypothetical protein